jgi:hypothetical protein
MRSLKPKEIKELKQKIRTIFLAFVGINQENLPSLKMQYLVDDYKEFIKKDNR